MKIKAVLFDFIGTTVKEKDSSVITSCLSKAFQDHGIFLTSNFFIYNRGKNKLAIIKEVLEKYNLPLSTVPKINDSFTLNIKNSIRNFSAFDDSLFVFSYLLRIGILIWIGTGLSREIFDTIFSHLGWTKRAFSYIGFSEEVGKNRPEPDMIFDMLNKLEIRESKEILKVGDTIADIQEGKNAGCLTAVVLSGTQPEEELLLEKPDYILKSLDDLKTIIK